MSRIVILSDQYSMIGYIHSLSTAFSLRAFTRASLTFQARRNSLQKCSFARATCRTVSFSAAHSSSESILCSTRRLLLRVRTGDGGGGGGDHVFPTNNFGRTCRPNGVSDAADRRRGPSTLVGLSVKSGRISLSSRGRDQKSRAEAEVRTLTTRFDGSIFSNFFRALFFSCHQLFSV